MHLWVKICPVCERNHNTACQGAIIEIGKEEPLRFNLYKVRDGMWVQADISIKTKRGGGKSLHLNEHNILVRLWHVDGTEPRNVVSRVHVDLANKDQHGPWAHLQFGGD
jgi:hypothetical protein